MGVEPASVGPCMPPSSTLSDMNISATRRPIAIKFYLKHHWGVCVCGGGGGGGGRLHKVLGQIGSDLWFPWQQIAPIGL